MISIIVPFYNSEKYITKCIESIVGQTIADWELLLVDDGSIDGSISICESYTKKDKRIKLFKGPCGGVSAARNKGLHQAKGKYICFVDSDDWLEKDALGIMLKEIDDADLLCTSYKKNSEKETRECRLRNKVLDVKSFVVKLFDSREIYQGYCWGKLYSRRIIEGADLTFNEQLSYNEDRLFVLQYTKKCKMIKLSCSITYNYRIHEESVMHLAAREKSAVRKKAYDELESSKVISVELNEKFQDAKEWLEYNLLKKIYSWTRQLYEDKELYKIIIDEKNRIEKQVFKYKNIDLVSKLKLFKPMATDFFYHTICRK